MDEDAILKSMQDCFRNECGGVVAGPGDDCAVVCIDGSDFHWLLKHDAVMEGVHFDAGTDPELIGRKAVNRAFSDIAAMGGAPLWVLSGIVVSAKSAETVVPLVSRGIAASAASVGAVLVGGDLSAGAVLGVHISVVGRVGKHGAVMRSGATPGDGIYVTGTLGGSRLGKHLSFVPRLEEGQWLQACGRVSSMIDLSDGIASDLRRIINASGVGARVNLVNIPVSSAAASLDDCVPALTHALCDGEDFELLFTVAHAKEHDFIMQWRKKFDLECARIGEITAEEGVLDAVDTDGRRTGFEGRGFDHFAGTRK